MPQGLVRPRRHSIACSSDHRSRHCGIPDPVERLGRITSRIWRNSTPQQRTRSPIDYASDSGIASSTVAVVSMTVPDRLISDC